MRQFFDWVRIVLGLLFLLLVPACLITSGIEAFRGHIDAAIYLLLVAFVIKREFDEEGGLLR